MKKRLFLLVVAIATCLVSMAYNFAGKTYEVTKTAGDESATFSISFTQTRYTMKAIVTGQKNQTTSGRYEVSGDIINMYPNQGGRDYFYIDNRQEYGEDCIYLLDPYGNVYLVFDRVATPTPTPSTKKSTKRKR